MKTRIITGFIVIALVTLNFGVAHATWAGSGTATGTATKRSSFARIGENAQDVPDWGKVTITSVTVLDKFGHAKTVRWNIVGGAGTSRPTIKITPALENGDYVSVSVTTSKDGSFGYVGLHIY